MIACREVCFEMDCFQLIVQVLNKQSQTRHCTRLFSLRNCNICSIEIEVMYANNMFLLFIFTCQNFQQIFRLHELFFIILQTLFSVFYDGKSGEKKRFGRMQVFKECFRISHSPLVDTAAGWLLVLELSTLIQSWLITTLSSIVRLFYEFYQ